METSLGLKASALKSNEPTSCCPQCSSLRPFLVDLDMNMGVKSCNPTSFRSAPMIPE